MVMKRKVGLLLGGVRSGGSASRGLAGAGLPAVCNVDDDARCPVLRRQDEDPERKPGAHAEPDGRLALEVAGERGLAEGPPAGEVHKVSRVCRVIRQLSGLNVVRTGSDDLEPGTAMKRHHPTGGVLADLADVTDARPGRPAQNQSVEAGVPARTHVRQSNGQGSRGAALLGQRSPPDAAVWGCVGPRGADRQQCPQDHGADAQHSDHLLHDHPSRESRMGTDRARLPVMTRGSSRRLSTTVPRGTGRLGDQRARHRMWRWTLHRARGRPGADVAGIDASAELVAATSPQADVRLTWSTSTWTSATASSASTTKPASPVIDRKNLRKGGHPDQG